MDTIENLRNNLLDLEVEAAQRGVLSPDDEVALAKARNLVNKVKAARTWTEDDERSTVA